MPAFHNSVQAVVIGRPTNVRQKPTTDSSIDTQISWRGNRVRMAAKPPEIVGDYRWLLVEANGYTGYVREDLIEWRGIDKSIRLSVPHVAQYGIGADEQVNDCGQACVTMLIHALTQLRPTVDEVCKISKTNTGKYQSMSALIEIAALFGIKLQRPVGGAIANILWYIDQLNAGRICIALIDYSKLTDRGMPSFAGAHFVVVTGYTLDGVLINDPLRKTGNWTAPWSEFIEAISTPSKAQGGTMNSAYLGLVTAQAIDIPLSLEQRIERLEKLAVQHGWAV